MGCGKLFQALTAIACGFASFAMGLMFVWPSYTLSVLRAENTTLLTVPLSTKEGALLSSLPSLGAMLGSALAGPLIDTFGRKIGSTAATLTYALSWSVICVSHTSIPILIARFVGGLGGGASLVFAPIFISEVVEDSIRGGLASVPILFFNIGALSSYIFGWFLGYHTIVWINLACGVVCCLLLMSVPESPVYLMKKNREEESRVCMAKYRGVSPSSMVVQKELMKIKDQITPAMELKSVDDKEEEAEKRKLTAEDDGKVVPPKSSAIKLLFTSPGSRSAFWMVMMVLSIQVMMGIGPVQVNAKYIFKQADPNTADLNSVLLAVVVVAGSLVTGLIADKAGRRVLIITSSILTSICMGTLGFLLQTRMGPPWMTVLMMMMYCFCFMCGAGSIPYVLMTEVFSPEVQGCASMLLIEWLWFLSFLILSAFSWVNDLMGIHGIFYIFAVDSIINAVVSFIFVPETKGLSNAQIQEIFLRRHRK